MSVASENDSIKRMGKIALGILGTIFLGAIGSGLWDLIFKPGVGRVGNFITSLSDSIDNAVFTTAALDPTSLPGLIFLLALVLSPVFIGMWVGLDSVFRDRFEEYLSKRIGSRLQESGGVSKRLIFLKRLRLFLGLAIAALLISLGMLGVVGFSVANEAVFVWREFQSNYDVCAPHISELQRLQLKARFRSMATRQDYTALQAGMDTAMTGTTTKLNWYGRKKP